MTKTLTTSNPPLTPVKWPAGPWLNFGIDLMGPFNSLPSYSCYALVLIDYYSKWPEIRFVGEPVSKSVLNFLKDVCMREGFPEILVAGNGVQFVSSDLEEFLEMRSIRHLMSSLYYLQTNGLVKHFSRVLAVSVC